MKGWTLIEADDATMLHRAGHAPVWDVVVTRALGAGPVAPRTRRRLAHQVRQDIWRAAQGIRGFVPVVRIGADPFSISAGGQLLHGGHRNSIAHRIAVVLDRPCNRRRWLAHAHRRAKS